VLVRRYPKLYILGMYRTVADFVGDWTRESSASMKVERTLTDASLAQKTYAEGRTLGQLAWHMALMIGTTGAALGLAVDAPARGTEQPASAARIAEAYEKAARSLGELAATKLKDEQLASEVPFFGRQLPIARILQALISHQIHHRGQMTVLMRQAGLVPPGIYGPTREEAAAQAAKQKGS
jgi:uncharacterized damage-inducible protein DinB